jgi:hypothetical protein
MDSQANYSFNIVTTGSDSGTRPVTWHREPRAFAGTAEEFAQAMLDDVLSGSPHLAGEWVFINVWRSDREGVFDASAIAARATHDPKAAIRRSAAVSNGVLPPTNGALVLRTDFSDDAAWDAACAASYAVSPEGFSASLSFVSDPAFDGLTADQVGALTTQSYRTFLFVADQVTMNDPEMPLAVIDLHDEPGRWFRVVPGRTWSVENNLSLANMFFREFADSTDPDGVFRGFPGEPRY